jgi:transposase
VIRVSQWAEIRHMHLVQRLSKREIARRLSLDVKTVRRALEAEQVPSRRQGPARSFLLDPWRAVIERWLKREPRLTAQRIGRLLEKEAGQNFHERTVRQYVAHLKARMFTPPAFVHRTHEPGQTLEGDFGESWAFVGGRLRKAHFFVATLPASNVYFAKAYPVERLECLLDGLSAAFVFFGGLPGRVVLDNTSLAVKEVLGGRERRETAAFAAYRGAWPFAADYCAPAKGWEKGSVEGGVKFVRNNFFRPIPKADTWEQLNAALEQELRREPERRRLEEGRTAAEAWQAERERLLPLPSHPPETCRILTRVADKFGHVRVDRAHYSIPIRHAWQPVLVKVFHDQVRIIVGEQIVACHGRVFEEGAKVLEAAHVLPLLEHKHRAAAESTALRQWAMPPVLERLRGELTRHTRKPDREWVQVLRLLETHPLEQVVEAVSQALESGSPRLETITLLLRQQSQTPPPACERLSLERAELARLDVAPANLENYDHLWRNENDEQYNPAAALAG